MTRRARCLVVCAACGTQLPVLSPRAQCACGGLLEALQCPRESGRRLRDRFERRRRLGDRTVAGSGVWRFRELLLPGRGPIVTHPEGNTSLYQRDAVAGYVGLEDLTLKHEGENPTGSF
ncbi:MAG: threonine synthase, partial [Acidobacteriota bacterium]